MISSLDRKLLRDLSQMKGQAFAIAIVIAAGVATFVNSRTMLHSLELTRATFYERYRFADVFARVKRAPDAMVDRLAEIPGVAQVETRIVETGDARRAGARGAGRRAAHLAAGDAAAAAEPALPAPRPAAGARPRRRGAGQRSIPRRPTIWTSATRSWPSSTAGARSCEIVGVAFSPEYVFQIKPGDMLPDPEHFGILWMEHEALVHRLRHGRRVQRRRHQPSHGASADEVIYRVDRLLEPYGGLGAFARKDQLSHLLLESDIQGLRTAGLIAPTIFLCVAAFLLNVVLTRLTSLQREQIAALKAFGYTNLQIAWHYMKFVLLITMAGGLLGTFGGMWLAHDFTKLFLRVYQYPELVFQVRPNVVAKAVLIAGGAAIAGAFGAIAAGRAVAAGRSHAARAARPLSADDPGADRLGPLRAQRRPHGPAATRTPSDQDVVFAAGDLHVGGDRRRRQLHAQLGRQGDRDAVLRRAAIRPVAGHGRAGVDRRGERIGQHAGRLSMPSRAAWSTVRLRVGEPIAAAGH